MDFKIEFFILMVIITIGLAESANVVNKPVKAQHTVHTFKREPKDQTAVADKAGQISQNVVYQQQHPQAEQQAQQQQQQAQQQQQQQPQQQQSQQQYQSGFIPITQYFAPAALTPQQVQLKDDYDVQYLKADSEASNYGSYQSPQEGYQTIAYSSNHPSHAKLASIIQLMAQQLAPLQFTYESLIPQLQQSYDQPKATNIAYYPNGYRQQHAAFAPSGTVANAPAPVGNPARSYAYPYHALQYTVLSPNSPNAKNSYPTSTASKVFMPPPPAQFSKYQFSQQQQQQQQVPNNAQYPNGAVNNGQSPNALYHPLIASQYDMDDKPQLFLNPNKGYQQPSQQYKQLLANSPEINHSGPISFTRFSSHLSRGQNAGQSKPGTVESAIYSNPPSQNVQKQQINDNNANPSKTYYSYGPHLLIPSENKLKI